MVVVHFELNLGAAMLNSEEIDIPCPECGHEASKTVDWIVALIRIASPKLFPNIQPLPHIICSLPRGM
ncbi:hypothetical protein GOC90_27280, partial [Sinorhizobium medicae]|nr:hypothetical protein [Sinorhizobium medicae]